MPPKKRKSGINSSTWESELRETIDKGEPEDVRAIERSLVALQRQAQQRLIALEQVTGTGVRLTDSDEAHDQEMGCNMNARHIDASFTAGPKAAPFRIAVTNENIEGDDHVHIESNLFTYKDEECGDVDDGDILRFLKKAGLGDAQPQRANGDYSNPVVRRRWVYGDIVFDAIELITGKYGFESQLGVGVGMHCEEMYGWLGLDY